MKVSHADRLGAASVARPRCTICAARARLPDSMRALKSPVMGDDPVIAEFSKQAEAFNTSGAMHAHETLRALVELVPQGSTQRWLDAACGPGIVSRELASRVGRVHGVDLTPKMVELARQQAQAEGLENVSFAVGDVTSLDIQGESFDGAIARFTLHHVSLPQRVVDELARVVRPGGLIVLADHVTDSDLDAAAWHQEIERLRDPSHWACLTPQKLHALCAHAGLKPEHEQVLGIAIDFDEWLHRGSGGVRERALIERSLAERPVQANSFAVTQREGRRMLELRLWRSSWRKLASGVPPAHVAS